ncbi:MAG TPA: HIT domain-containing protein [Myxococcales bacterium]|nr:HIT domain-containing protein [Myxococcales bacterium]
MDQLWAPWRMELVSKGEAPSGCIFCDLPLERDDRKNLILGRTGRTFAMLNKYPYNNGHLMVIPRMHASDVHALPDADYQELSDMLRVALRLVGRAYAPQGANLGMNLGRVAGAGIADHLHWHVVPRWGGDTNFMPVLADTKVMVEHLNATWDRLRPLFDAEYRRGEPVTSW